MGGRFLYLIALLGVLLGSGFTVAEAATVLRPSEHRGIQRAREALAQEDYARARAALDPLLEREKRHPLVDFYRGVIAQSQDEHAEACVWFERSVAGDETLNAAWVNLAQEYAPAAQAFERSYSLAQPKEPRWGYNAALAWYQSGEMPRALALMQQLLDDFPAEVELQWRELLVHIYLDRGGEDDEESLRRALPHVQILAQESSAAAQRRWREYLIHVYLQLQMPEKALQFVTRLLEQEIVEPRWWRIAAHLHLEAQRYPEALVALQVAGFLAPGDAREERLRADLCMHLGIPAQAIPYFTSLLESDSSDLDGQSALLGLAQAYLQRHKPQEALKYLDRIEAQHESAAQLHLRARILYMLADYPRAYAAYAELAREENDPRGRAQAWLFAAYAAWNADEIDKTREALQNAEQAPEYRAQAHQLRRYLHEKGK
jgi:predicted Zn-dependent protease